MKRGFTLIELLAVIVILAIIATIAVPIVLNIIAESKHNAILRSVDFYLDAVEYTIADAFLYDGGLSDGTYLITEEGNICKTLLPCDEDDTLKVEVNGEKPSGNKIVLKDGKIVNYIIKFGEVVVKCKVGKGGYEMLDGDVQSIRKTVSSELMFRSSAPFDDFKEVLIDGNVVSASNYTVSGEDTKIIFTDDFRRNLSYGKHEIEIVSEQGSALGTFYVEDLVAYSTPKIDLVKEELKISFTFTDDFREFIERANASGNLEISYVIVFDDTEEYKIPHTIEDFDMEFVADNIMRNIIKHDKINFYISVSSNDYNLEATNNITFTTDDCIGDNSQDVIDAFKTLRSEARKIINGENSINYKFSTTPSSDYKLSNVQIIGVGEYTLYFSVSDAGISKISGGGKAPERVVTISIDLGDEIHNEQLSEVKTGLYMAITNSFSRKATMHHIIENESASYYAETLKCEYDIVEAHRQSNTPYGIAYANFFNLIDSYK